MTGEDEASLDAAEVLIQELLKPLEDDDNIHKQNQLRQLAIIQGTFDEADQYCQICSEQGHRHWECPQRTNSTKPTAAADVQCAVCGDRSHPTRDCPMKKKGADVSTAALDSEYNSFLNELTGGLAVPTGTSQPPSRTSAAVEGKEGGEEHGVESCEGGDRGEGGDGVDDGEKRQASVSALGRMAGGEERPQQKVIEVSFDFGDSVTTAGTASAAPVPAPPPPSSDPIPQAQAQVPAPVNAAYASASASATATAIATGGYDEAALLAYYQANPDAYYVAQKAQFEQLYPGQDFEAWWAQAQAAAAAAAAAAATTTHAAAASTTPSPAAPATAAVPPPPPPPPRPPKRRAKR